MQERFKNFTILIATINRCIHKIKSEEMSHFDLKSSHVSCLYYLYLSDPCTATELCEACGEDKANMSRTIRHLEECGYVTCSSPSNKRYQGILQLTERGEEVGKYVTERIDSILEVAGGGLSDEERSKMYESLAIISANLSMICSEYDSDGN